jgi:hypothetical protein
MDSVSNMSDAMLVLAVGIMLALVINWKVDLQVAYQDISERVSVNEEVMQEIDSDNMTDRSNSVSFEDIMSKYKKSGTVYTDVYSGKTYVIMEE